MFFLLLGEAVSALGVGLPGNVIGMLLLTAALAMRVVRVEQVRRAADTLLDNLALLFVPPGVGVMLYFGVVAESLAAIAVAIVLSTVLVLVGVGTVTQLLLRSAADGPTRLTTPGDNASDADAGTEGAP